MVIRGHATIGLTDDLRALWNRRGIFTSVAIPVAATAVTLFNVWSQPITQKDAEQLVLFVVGVSVAIWLAATALTVLFRAFANARTGDDERNVTLELNDDGHIISDRTGASITMPWNLFDRAKETSHALYLHLRKGQSRYLPVRAFDPADLPAMRTLLREKFGNAAKLRRD